MCRSDQYLTGTRRRSRTSFGVSEPPTTGPGPPSLSATCVALSFLSAAFKANSSMAETLSRCQRGVLQVPRGRPSLPREQAGQLVRQDEHDSLKSRGKHFEFVRPPQIETLIRRVSARSQVDQLQVNGRTMLAVPGYEPKEKFEFGAITSFAYPLVGSGRSRLAYPHVGTSLILSKRLQTRRSSSLPLDPRPCSATPPSPSTLTTVATL